MQQSQIFPVRGGRILQRRSAISHHFLYVHSSANWPASASRVETEMGRCQIFETETILILTYRFRYGNVLCNIARPVLRRKAQLVGTRQKDV